MLSTKAKDSRNFKIGIEYGWRARRVWFRAPNRSVYEQWNDVIRAAVQGTHGGGFQEDSLARWVERSGISMMETATTSGAGSMDRFSTDSYVRGCSKSYRSDIPDDEWSAEDGNDRGERSHGVNNLTLICARYRNTGRERTDTAIWMGRPAFSSTEVDS
ncbi:hypothetical protein P3T76_011394 [Phytophthora citrophthora]|uniref:PH domain-containing protein n=1 Tax=Phytophthora citrophthora TaxID=4793 RepID=A0AAD9LF98_9STRA|nr:hypothetical protein P3T76_011394 [Phytophthora citrophthora]